MKPLEYIVLFVVIFAYFWKRGKNELSSEGKEPESFKHAIQRGFFETVESIKSFHQKLAPEVPVKEDQDEYSNFSGVKAPAHLTYDPNPTSSRFSNLNEKKNRGRFVVLDEQKVLKERQAEATERINNLY